jgi:hypothetical protein
MRGDEVIITAPPLYCCFGRCGQPVCVPVSRNRSKRVIHGAVNIVSGDLLFLITEVWDEVTDRHFLNRDAREWDSIFDHRRSTEAGPFNSHPGERNSHCRNIDNRLYSSSRT